MMFKKTILLFFSMLFLFIPIQKVAAEESETIPDAEILIVYSDGINTEGMEQVREIVKILTYQNMKISFASATDCEDELSRFSNIICYDLENYSEDFINNLYDFEQDALLEQNSNEKQLLIIGNQFLKDYYDTTDRSDSYIQENKKTGRLTYYFDSFYYRETLADENMFVFLKDTTAYSNGEMEVGDTIGYYAGKSGVITHFSLTNLNDNVIRAAFSKEVAQWKWPYLGEPHKYAQYMVINMVYPYESLEKLQEIVNLMVDKKEPFVISVMPVYAHGDYPAMQRFCEVLRYAQANGGAIVMHTPNNQMTNFDKDLMLEYISIALDIYIDQGVYPMALQVPGNWIFNKDTIEIMSHFRTIFTTEEEDVNVPISEDLESNDIFYKDGHQWISESIGLDQHNTSYISVSSTAVNISMQDDMQEIKDKIKACQSSLVPLKSLWDSEHSVWMDDIILTYEDRMILYNNETIDNVFIPNVYDEKYKYHRNVLSRFSKDLTYENQKLVIAVTVISIVFILFILVARYNNRKKFFHDPDEPG